MKCLEIVKNAHHPFLDGKVRSSNGFFSPATVRNPKTLHVLSEMAEKEAVYISHVGHSLVLSDAFPSRWLQAPQKMHLHHRNKPIEHLHVYCLPNQQEGLNSQECIVDSVSQSSYSFFSCNKSHNLVFF